MIWRGQALWYSKLRHHLYCQPLTLDLWCKFWLLCFQSGFLLMHQARQWMMAQVLRPLLLIWKTRIELLAGAAMESTRWLVKPGLSHGAAQCGFHHVAMNKASISFPVPHHSHRR